ncbi:MAG TPA: CpsD/CapB family tyrosine-protein kinase [Ktedonobacteraceae bacterium]|nr:CpsD/CapB family tyrosine-protein kinase [Ktedonobacteraceae bacterium]
MGKTSQEKHTLLTDYDTHSAYSEALHTLFANIRFQWEQESARSHSLLITTPYAYGDYPALAANLAIVAAQSGAQTVLVDANMRAPVMQQRFGLEKTTGLSDLLADTALTPEKVSSALQATFVPGLQLLGAGTQAEQGPALLLTSRLAEVIHSLCLPANDENGAEKTERIVLFHSSPVLAGADASLIGALVDQTALAIIANRTTRAQAKQAQEQLQRARAKLAGIVMVSM